MSKRSIFTEITPLPHSISRETAINLLHDHVEMIQLNPLVIRHQATAAPANATKDEVQFMTWYELTDEIQFIPGTSLKNEVTYKGGFYDLPRGLQTHVFAPGGVDIQAKWLVGGNMPGEPRETFEMGVEKPREGLYLREEVDLRCNIFLTNFVKRNLKKSHSVLVQRLVKKVDLAERSKSQIDRLDTFRSTNSDRMVSFRNDMQTPSPASTDFSPHTPRRSGTECTCTGKKHLIACPYYSRLYQPPLLFTAQVPASGPTSTPPTASSVTPTHSWTGTPVDNYEAKKNGTHEIHLGFEPASAAPEPLMSGRGSSALPEPPSTIDASAGQHEAQGDLRPAPLNPRRSTERMAVELNANPEEAMRYYEYQAQRAELE